jgi:hypothetical protein
LDESFLALIHRAELAASDRFAQRSPRAAAAPGSIARTYAAQ